MKKLIAIFGASLALLLMFSSCADKGGKMFDHGTIEGTQYKNAYFRFSLKVPQGWYVLNRSELEQAQKIGARSVPNKALGKQLQKAQDVQNASLLVVYRDEPGTNEGFNPSFQAVAENLARHKDIKNAEQYQRQVLEMFKMSGLEYYDLDVPVERAKIGGQEFDYIRLKINYGGYDVCQDWYVILRNNFALSFGLTYTDESQHDVLYEALANIEFARAD